MNLDGEVIRVETEGSEDGGMRELRDEKDCLLKH